VADPSLVLWNPGELVFDQETGEPYITPDGELVEVAPGLLVQAPDGRTLDGDDVANAAWLRANIYQGECLRAADVGVPYLQQALGQSDDALAVDVVVAEVTVRTPGVGGVVDVRSQGVDPLTRVLHFTCTLLRQGGGEQPFAGVAGP
jgi:hypothetical protein